MTRSVAGLLVVFLSACHLGCGNHAATPSASFAFEKQPGAVVFEDVTTSSGVRFTYRNGEEANHLTILESLGGGVGLIDYDQDGMIDVLLLGEGHFGPGKDILGYPNRLFRNEGHCRFRDVTAEVGLPTSGDLLYSHGCAIGDFDNDGWPDVLVTGYGRMILYRNDHGKFVDVTEKSGLANARPLHWSTGAAWGDLDGDGWLDLFVTHYVDWSFQNHPRCGVKSPGDPPDVCHPTAFKPLLPAVYRNNRDGTFTEMTDQVGLKPCKGLGVLLADVNDDGMLDVYVANDTLENHLYLNQGNWHFKEAGGDRGVALGERGRPDGSMGIAAADVDRSGRMSLFVSNFEGEAHALYLQLANGQFTHASARAGLTSIGLRLVGFGTSFLDFDNDGMEDLLLVNGHVAVHPNPPATRKQRPVLFRNTCGKGESAAQARFVDLGREAGPYFDGAYLGRGLAVGDVDNDGMVDAIVSHVNEPATVLRNVVHNGYHWLGVQLIGSPNPDGIGAKLTLEIGSQRLTRWILGGGSYLSANDKRVVFGLGSVTSVGPLTVRWPGGKTESWNDLGVDQYHVLRQGQGTP